jgi:hypothetical protein
MRVFTSSPRFSIWVWSCVWLWGVLWVCGTLLLEYAPVDY